MLMSPGFEPSYQRVPLTTVPLAGHLRRKLAQAAIASVLYFAAAYLALLQQSGAAGVAFFWPAAGIAAGLMIALGAQAYVPVAIGTVAATLAANLAFGRDPVLSLTFGLLNAAEALAVAWVLTHLPKRREIFPRLMEIFSFFLAAAISTAMAAAAAASVLQAYAGSSTPWPDIWWVWFLSDFIGVAVVAPLVIASATLIQTPARHHDWSMDIALLLLLLGTSWHALTIRLGSNSWLAVAPGTTVLPILIWLSARGQPIVPAIAVVLLASVMAVAATLGFGRYGDPDIPAATRVLAAQATLGAVSLVTLVVSALFDERRTAEARIRTGERRLAITADAVPGVIFSLQRDATGHLNFPFVSAKARVMFDLEPEALAASAEPFLARLDRQCRASLLSALEQRDGQQEAIRLELSCREPSGQIIWLEISAAPVMEADGTTIWHGFLQNVTSRRVLVQELNHRTRNLLAVVQSVAQHTARTADPATFSDALDERLSGLAASHSVLAARQWQGAEISTLARSQLAHLVSLIDTRLLLSGPKLIVKPRAAQVLGMAIHELGTNAMKHGALSNDTGTVRLTWETSGAGASERFRVRWEEAGGPSVAAIKRRGFGRTVTIDMVAYELEGTAELEAHPTGIQWRVEAPASRVLFKMDAVT